MYRYLARMTHWPYHRSPKQARNKQKHAAGNIALSATQRRLAAIAAADVVGYGRLMGADEEGAPTAIIKCALHPKMKLTLVVTE